MSDLHREIATCTLCAPFLPLGPRPVVQFSPTSRLLIVGQAPGTKVHDSGIPWNDASGARLCEWTGLTNEELHDPAHVAIVPMGFCYPGKGKSGDLPPRPECAALWHERVLARMADIRLTLLVGAHAQLRYLPQTRKLTMGERVRRFQEFGPAFFPLPHPSWRSTIFMRQNPWFEAEVVPALRRAVAGALAD
ncbi:uracil-DNA glycosylase family protein [Altererythrobacter sp. CC-YST694]|uniref:uracil-DNA glycosylase family protein n=1 Tax=Altererythrobacter sp. CC-YST694 TaxID=2755038 RepID=UPI001D014A4C|nr:uracil-DNA glycosylase family protein [Altererythrobacter sp. CC-YST694]MCB5424781.1 uracil-DNA glycosylase family protein [Altererythrobacter sp. CC-YST694]